ncbi:hypothetical protein JR334_02625 [Clostridia bacterium]|nr:hypothetical protein JR334_02625 [Clostridia bacterium]
MLQKKHKNESEPLVRFSFIVNELNNPDKQIRLKFEEMNNEAYIRKDIGFVLN